MDWSERPERFRALLEGDSCVHMASVHDPLAGRIAEEIGSRSAPSQAGRLPWLYSVLLITC